MDRWSQLSLKDKSDLMSLYIQNGISSLEEIKKHYNSFQAGGPVPSKTPNFVQRFNEGNKRDIPVKDGFATHLLGYAERDGRYYVYPDVQPTDYNDSNSPLQYYGRDWRVAFDRAYDNNDYLEFDTEEAARNYTENYKKVPSTGAVLNGRNRGNYNILDYIRGYQNGGSIKPNKIGYSAPPVDSSLEGVSMETPFYRPNNPEYIKYWETLPDNQKYTSNDEYDSYLYWQLNGKPRHFQEAKRKGMFTWDSSDNSYHGNSIAYDEKGNGRFIKPKKHDTVKYELDWYNKGLITEEGGVQRQMTPKEKAEWENFRKEYELVDDPERPNFYMYRRRHSNGGYLFPDVGSLGKITPYGQWQYPHQVTTIPSNNITMKGVNYPVIGVSNTGDTKYMLPNMDYLFEGQYVTEYPVHKYQIGGFVPKPITVSGTTPETSDNTYVYNTIADSQIDRREGLPKGTTTARKAMLTKVQPVIEQKEIPEDTQKEINRAIQFQKVIEPINQTLDVAENIPVVGDAVTVGRAASDATDGNYSSATLLPLMFLGNRIPFGKRVIKGVANTPLVLARSVNPDGLEGLLKFNYTEGAPSLGMMRFNQNSLDRLAETYANNEGITFLFDRDLLRQPHLSFLGDADTPIKQKAARALGKRISEFEGTTPEEIVEGKRLLRESLLHKPITDKSIIKNTRKDKFLRDDEFYNEVLMDDILDYRKAKGAIINTDNENYINMLEELKIPYGYNLESIPFEYKGFKCGGKLSNGKY